MLNMNFEEYPRFDQFKGKTILSVDYGTKVTGLAFWGVGREPFPGPYGKIIYQNDDQVCQEIKTIYDDEACDVIVVGLPLYADGTDSEMTKRVRSFAAHLSATIADAELHFQDETLSSFTAQERMKNSPRYGFKVDPKQLDALAATIILEDFIRHQD
ncbi:MAG: Holliday junction resolvase RuvX [Bdellovibrionales bacterium CG12_big_fil_rev_8_21_14_0_65_38_15]|nr:MAG: Holliday junction resolvase RuvX [Bdellovibrionales bacterium CG22_combo_CG10-13_8_21_14_all_38_13]PIQ54761.1 MAG: Holliday junction resolvase RuvX [Bdellovibrionales bacterium CG12_big_fil_rev_8_21_14_0_65_38_15]PIR31316.1 MAG: Holliday junction resolvase RuvX [Bdellovibrionales bacterium CG11_big_fil_rev_8_21_14_0_20_38_13]